MKLWEKILLFFAIGAIFNWVIKWVEYLSELCEDGKIKSKWVNRIMPLLIKICAILYIFSNIYTIVVGLPDYLLTKRLKKKLDWYEKDKEMNKKNREDLGWWMEKNVELSEKNVELRDRNDELEKENIELKRKMSELKNIIKD